MHAGCPGEAAITTWSAGTLFRCTSVQLVSTLDRLSHAVGRPTLFFFSGRGLELERSAKPEWNVGLHFFWSSSNDLKPSYINPKRSLASHLASETQEPRPNDDAERKAIVHRHALARPSTLVCDG